MFVPSVARKNEKAAKNVAARLSQLLMRRSGSQKMPLYRTAPALVTAIPMNPTKVKAIGMMMSWMYCARSFLA